MKFLDLTGLNKFWAKLKGYFAKLNLTYGTRGFVSGAGSNPEILLEKMKLGTMQLYNGPYGISVKLYVYDADDEANATLVWDSTTLEGEPLEKFKNGRDMGTIYTSPAGKCVKAVYDGHAAGAYYYIRAFGVFMTPKQADSSHKATAVCKINGTNYASYTIDTYGGLVTAVCPDGNFTYLELKFTPNTDDVRMRFYGFRCLNTYDGVDAVLIGRSSTTSKLYTARKLAVNLANSSTDSTFDGSADQTGIKVSGTLPVGNGGTGKTDAASACNMFINALSTATETPFDNDYYVSQYANGGTTTTTFYRRPVSALWTYIKGKLTSVSGVNISGNAATASSAQSGSALETAINNKADTSSTVSNVAWDSTNKKITKTINGTTSDVVTAATLKTAMSLNNVTNDAQVKRTEMGTANGVATLDANGVINTSQLPSYVDDVLEYSAKSQFPATGETGKIYVDTSTNLTWRWSGTTYVEISPSLALGETSSTAYRGDRGKTAYDHSQLTSGNPHHVTAEDVKAVRYDTNAQGLTDTQKSNARANIGAGTSSLTLGTTATTAAAGNHAHGNITNGGALQTTDITIANRDKLVVTDASDSNKIARTSVAFDGSTTTKALTQKGTFETFQGDVKIQLVEYGALQYSDVTAIISAGKVPVVYSDNSLYVCDGTAYQVNGVNEYRFTKPSGNVDSPRISYMRIRDDSTGWGGGAVALASTSALSTKADASVVSTLSSDVVSHTTLFHSDVLDVTDKITRFLKITFSGRVGRCIAIVIISGGTDATSAAFRLSWEYIKSTDGITGIGREMFSCSNLSKPPLVYKDNDSFYIGLYESRNRGATVSVMMTSENPSNVSFSTVTRAVATASDKTELPITWHTVESETIDEIHAAIYDDTSGTTVATTFNELKSWYSPKPNIILVERHHPSGSVSTTQKVYMLTDTSYSQGNPTKFVFTRVRNDTDYMGDVETMTCTSSGWTYSISNTKNATYAVSAGSADSATTATSSTYATSAGTAAVANGYSTGGAIDQALQGLESHKLTTSDVYSDASGTASFLAIAAVPVVIDISSSQGVDIEALIRGTVSSAYRYNATSTKPYSRLWVLVNTSSHSKTFSGFADGSSLKIGAYRTACVVQIGPNFYKPDA